MSGSRVAIPSPTRQHQRSQRIDFASEMIHESTIIELALSLDEDNFGGLLEYLSGYYHNDSGIISDEKYDELVDIYEAKYGRYNVVGAEPTGDKVDLPHYLGSLRKIKKATELTRWLEEYKGPYIVEDKIDGLTLLLVSKVFHGRRVSNLYTRGGGYRGTDVSHLIDHMSWPEWVKSGQIEVLGGLVPNDISIRGEIVMSKDAFQRVGAGFKNARNLVSGIENSKKKFNQGLARELSFYPYRIIGTNMTPTEEINTLHTLGFRTPSPVSAPHLTQEILENYFKQRKTDAVYEIDGLVLYQDVAAEYPVGDAPRHVVAFKTETETATTTVNGVTWEGSKDRLLKPVVHYEPVTLSGAVLQRASGYNARFIIDNNIGPGATILITRSGDVIPKILSVLAPAPGGPDYPRDRRFGWNENQVEFVLLEDDDEVVTNKLHYFIEKLDIKGFGPERVRQLVDSGIKDIRTLLLATPEQISNIPGIGPILSNQLYTDLHSKITNIPGPLIMAASGFFPNVGIRRFEAIFAVYPNFIDMIHEPPNVVETYIRNVSGFDKLASEISQRLRFFGDWLRDNPMITVKRGNTHTLTLNFSQTPPSTNSNQLNGVTVVFSGFRDKGLEEQIRQRGGRVTTSVSRNTTFLVMKDINDRKGKANDAEAKGVRLISKEHFIHQYIY